VGLELPILVLIPELIGLRPSTLLAFRAAEWAEQAID